MNVRSIIVGIAFIIAGLLLFMAGCIYNKTHINIENSIRLSSLLLDKNPHEYTDTEGRIRFGYDTGNTRNGSKEEARRVATELIKSVVTPYVDSVAQTKKEVDNTVETLQLKNDSSKYYRKIIDSLKLAIAMMKPIIITKVSTQHDTILTYAQDPMIKDYYQPARLKKIGFGQDVLPLYGLRLQALSNYNFTQKTFSMGLGFRYDFNHFSTLVAGYYNFTTHKASIVNNSRVDLIRF